MTSLGERTSSVTVFTVPPRNITLEVGEQCFGRGEGVVARLGTSRRALRLLQLLAALNCSGLGPGSAIPLRLAHCLALPTMGTFCGLCNHPGSSVRPQFNYSSGGSIRQRLLPTNIAPHRQRSALMGTGFLQLGHRPPIDVGSSLSFGTDSSRLTYASYSWSDRRLRLRIASSTLRRLSIQSVSSPRSAT